MSLNEETVKNLDKEDFENLNLVTQKKELTLSEAK